MAATESVQPFVAVVCGNASDALVAQHAINMLDRLRINYERRVLQARDEDVVAYIDEAKTRGLAVVIIGAYHTYTDEQFPTTLQTLLPIFRFVTGPMPVILDKVALNIALTGSGRDGAEKAALQAARILALTDPALAERLRAGAP